MTSPTTAGRRVVHSHFPYGRRRDSPQPIDSFPTHIFSTCFLTSAVSTFCFFTGQWQHCLLSVFVPRSYLNGRWQVPHLKKIVVLTPVLQLLPDPHPLPYPPNFVSFKKKKNNSLSPICALGCMVIHLSMVSLPGTTPLSRLPLSQQPPIAKGVGFCAHLPAQCLELAKALCT